MVDKYINEVGLKTLKNWIEGKFALDEELDALSETVQELVTEGGEPNKIDTITVNGDPMLPDESKNVEITVPTKVSELINDGDGTSGSSFATADEVNEAIGQAVSSAYKYKGSVPTVDDLPTSGNTEGDVYDVQSHGVNYAWTGSEWDALGEYVDTTLFWTNQSGQANTLEAMTVSEINDILNGGE